MRIALIMPLSDQIGGAEKLFIDFLRFNPRKKDFIIIFLHHGPMVNEIENLGFETLVIESGKLRQIFQFFKTIGTLRKIFRDRKIDLIFSWMPKAQLYGGPAALFARVPNVWFNHDMARVSFWDIFINLIPARNIFTPSKITKAYQEKIWPKRSIQHIYPGINLNDFKPSLVTQKTLRDSLNLPKKSILIGTFGRLQSWKNQHLLVQILPKLLKYNPSIVLVIVGGPHPFELQYKDYLVSEIKRLNLTNKIILAGHQTNISLWIEAMDMVIQPAENEPFGLSIIEAMAMGKVVIAANCGGPKEIIEPQINGLIFRNNDPADLAQKIEQTLDNPALVNSISREARQRAKCFSIEKFIFTMNKELFENRHTCPNLTSKKL